MLSCTRFMDRLYDEDSRRAMETDAPAPRDMAEHITACAECGRAWGEAAADVRSLAGLLTPSVPTSVERRLRLRLAEPLMSSPQSDWLRAAAWRSAVGAAAALTAAHALPAALAGLGPLLLALVGASIAFAASTLSDALRDAI